MRNLGDRVILTVEPLGLPVHPLADAFPWVEGKEYDELVASIAEVGQQQPALTWTDSEGQTFLIDGRNRLRVCRHLGIKPVVREWKGDESELPGLLIALNLRRRHLSATQRAVIGERLATMTHGGARHGSQEAHAPHEMTLRDAAEAVDVSVKSLQYVRSVRRAGREDLMEQLAAGSVSARGAAEQVKADERTRQERTAAFHAARRDSGGDEWLTPPHIIDRVVRLLGHIDLDPCSDVGRNVPAARHFVGLEGADALAEAPWANPDGSPSTVYMNPPYGFNGVGCGPWTRRLVAEHEAGRVERGVMLLPGRLGAHWLDELRPYPRVEFRRGTVSFIPGAGNPMYGEPPGAAPFPVIAVGVGISAASMAQAFGDLGAVMVAYDRIA